MKRATIVLAASLGGLLVAEGALSLLGLPRFAERLSGSQQRASTTRAENAADAAPEDLEAAPVDGLYQAHVDPRVGYTFRRNAELELVGAPFRTTGLGFRAEPAGQASGPQTQLLVLGDSVAFGYGLRDAETLAAQLEELLSPLAGDDAPALRARSLAVPGWNHRQSIAALADHWPAYTPRVVVYLPISNDLGTASAPVGNGLVRLAADPNEPDPRLLVSRSQSGRVERELLRLRQSAHVAQVLSALGLNAAELRDAPNDFGPRVIECDLSPESSRRYDENAASILQLQAFLTERGAKLLVFFNGDSAYTAHLARRLERAAPELPLLFGQRGTTPSMQLEGDAHPNADTVAARAVWVAEELLELGWIPRREGAEWEAPEVPEAYAALRFDPRAGGGLAARDEHFRTLDLEALRSEIVVPAALGTRQIFGGLNPGGSAQQITRLLLRAEGAHLRVQTAALPSRLDTAPMRVQVHVNGVALGEIVVPRQGQGDARLPLPADTVQGAPIEVTLLPERSVITRERGVERVASFLLRRVATE